MRRLGNGYLYNPTRQLKTGAQGHREINPETGSTYSPKYAFNLYALNRRNMSFARTSFGRLLTRLHLEYKHEGDHHNLYREMPPEVWFEGDNLLKRILPPQLVYSSTDTSKLVDWVVGVYVPNLLATGTVPPPPAPKRSDLSSRMSRSGLLARP